MTRPLADALEVEVSHSVGTFQLTADFSLQAGSSVLFGPSGAGKSLTLAIIAGLVRPQAGRVAIGGRVVTDTEVGLHEPTQQRRVGMVFQDGRLLPHRSVLDNVALAVRTATGRRKRRARAMEWLERVGATDLADRRPASLSGGQSQRVALARALAGDPALLLLDEPLSALDLEARGQMQDLLVRVVSEQAVPSLTVTHDPAEAALLGQRIVSLDGGSVSGIADVRA
ncbi:MAG: ABC transporter ATP-binding protein [Acidimicrobiales bacterium]